MFGLSPGHLLLLLLVVVLIFGTKKLRNVGEDLGAAVKSFRKGLQSDDEKQQPQLKADPAPGATGTADAKHENTPQG